jgi:hypothetical protein
MTVIFDCGGCGRRLKVSEVYRGKRTKCPECAAISVVPEYDDLAVVDPGAIQEAPAAGGTARVGQAGGQAEGVGVAEISPTCPSCRKILPRGAVLCVECGHDFRTGRQLETAHERFEKRWEVGPPLAIRLGLLIGLECLCLPAGALTREVSSGLALIFAGSVFLILILGTYIKLHLVRTGRGKIMLTRTWCICFIPAIRHQVNVRSYDVILIDATRTDIAMLLFMIVLLFFGVCPGLIWWYILFTRVTYHISLRKDRLNQEFVLYQSMNDTKMRDIVDTLQDLSGLRVDRR